MTRKQLSADAHVEMSGDYWNHIQETLQLAVDGCNVITSQIAAHEYKGKRTADELLETIDSDVRAIRKLLEDIQTPI